MTASSLDVVCIGNAIVDVLSQCENATITRLSLNRGTMTLIDAARAEDLYRRMGPAIEASGGSAANTAAGLASLGARAAFVGKVKDDELGRIFRHDLRNAGVEFETAPGHGGAPTARCLIFITPDAQRTMNTYLGACIELAPADIDAAQIARAAVTYMEGYLWDPPAAKEAFLLAAAAAHKAGRKVALTLSDPFCVERHRDSFLDLVRNHVDLLFANEAELCALYRVADVETAARLVGKDCAVAAITQSAQGSTVVAGKTIHRIDAVPVRRVIDTTGAGDLYAAGFLAGFTAGRDLPSCGRIGALAAAEVIAHVGPRPQTNLQALVAEKFGAAA